MQFKFTPGPNRIQAIQAGNDWADQTKPEANISTNELIALCYGPLADLKIQASPSSAYVIPVDPLSPPVSMNAVRQYEMFGPLNFWLRFETASGDTSMGEQTAVMPNAVNVMGFAISLASAADPKAIKAALTSAFGPSFNGMDYSTGVGMNALALNLSWLRELLTSWQDVDGTQPYGPEIAHKPAPDRSIIAKPLT